MKYDFTAENNLLVVSTQQQSGAYQPEQHTYKRASTEFGYNVISLMESGMVKQSFRFHEIATVGGVAPTDMQDANTKIKNLIPV